MVLQQEIEKVQNMAVRSVTSSYCFETGSMTGILGKLKWESLEKRRRDSRLILFYKGLKGAASIPADDLISPSPPPPAPRPAPTPTPPPIRRNRNHHSLTFQTSAARTDIYKGSFFPQTIRDWNALPDSIILPLLKVQRIMWLGLPLW